MRIRSFRRKLLALIVLAVGGGQALMTVLVLWGEAERYAVSKRDLLLAQAHVLASAVSGATARGDVRGVYAGLRAAGSLPAIRFVSVSDLAGTRIAELGAAELLSSDLLIDRSSDLSAWRLLWARSFALRAPVVEGGAVVGTVALIGDAGDLKANLKSGLLTFAGACAAALGLALAITLRMQGIITRPLTGLVHAMQSVAASHNYAVAVSHSEISELNILIEGFNGMLGEIRERDRQIARNYAELEQQVQDRTRDLRAAKEAAEISRSIADEANTQKSTFLATMSHEIRTPMNGMLAMAELLARLPLPPVAQRYADVIWRSGKSLLAVVNDILDFSKIEAGKLELERAPLDIVETVTTVLDLFGERARAKGLDLAARIDVGAPTAIVGDAVRLTQILSNLVNNALKFTERGGVRVIVEPGDLPNSVRFAVEDTGVGVPVDKIEHVFSAFSQADMSTTRKYGGTGLGLAICQRLAQAMGAKIDVVSELEKGSVFSFVLRDCAESWTPWPARGADVAMAEISICGRGAFTRDALAYYARCAGFSTVFVEPGELAQRLRPGQFVVADWDEAAAPALVQAQTLGIGIVALRTDESAPDCEGAQAVLSWPVARTEFERVLEALLAGRPLRASNATRVHSLWRKFDRLKVLVADDNEINREVAKEALEQMGATVSLVCDGLEAVKAYETSRFDLIMLDGSMPGLSGFDAARQIRQMEAESGARRTPIIAFTARVLGASATEWRDAGMDALVAKPLTLEQLSHGIERALGAGGYAPAIETEDTMFVDSAPDLIDGKLLYELSRSSSGNGFLARIVGLYTSHAPEAVSNIERFATNGDFDGMAKAAHALKSMSLNIGASAVAQSAAQLEIGAKNGASDLVGVEHVGRLVAATCRQLAREASKVEQALHQGSGSLLTPAAGRKVGSLF